MLANVVMPAVVVPMASADVVLVKPIVAVDVRGAVVVGAPVDDDVVAVVVVALATEMLHKTGHSCCM